MLPPLSKRTSVSHLLQVSRRGLYYTVLLSATVSTNFDVLCLILIVIDKL